MKPIDLYKLMTSPEEVRKHELTHYGVLGMKWGVRHEVGPNGLVRKSVGQNGDAAVKGTFTDTILPIALRIAVPLLVWKGLDSLYQHEMKRAFQDRIDTIEKPHRDIKDLDSFPPGVEPQPQPIDADSLAVNEHWADRPYYQSNCSNCAAAYELRRRGYDVKALPRPEGKPIEEIYKTYEGTTPINMRPPNSVDRARELVSKWGEGARGSIVVQHSFGSHIFNVEVKDGKVIFVDSQIGAVSSDGRFSRTSPSSGYKAEYDVFDPDDTFKTIMFRTDNLKLSKEILKGVGNAKRKKG